MERSLGRPGGRRARLGGFWNLVKRRRSSGGGFWMSGKLIWRLWGQRWATLELAAAPQPAAHSHRAAAAGWRKLRTARMAEAPLQRCHSHRRGLLLGEKWWWSARAGGTASKALLRRGVVGLHVEPGGLVRLFALGARAFASHTPSPCVSPQPPFRGLTRPLLSATHSPHCGSPSTPHKREGRTDTRF